MQVTVVPYHLSAVRQSDRHVNRMTDINWLLSKRIDRLARMATNRHACRQAGR